MKKNYTRFVMVVAVFLLALMSSQTKAQSVVMSESFDGTTFVPAGWSLFPNPVPTQAAWSRRTTASAPLTNGPHSGAAMASFRSSTVNANGATQSLITPAFDLTARGANTAAVTFWMYRDSNLIANMDSLVVLMNTTADTTGAIAMGVIARNRMINLPDTQLVNGWYSYTFNYPASFTGTTNFILFKGVCRGGVRIYIDDVSYDTYPPQCSGIPNVGSIVNGSHVICGGSGATTLTLTAPISGVSGLTYQWMSASSAAGTYTNFGTGGVTENTGAITATTYYQCMVTCSASGLSYTTPVDSVIVSTNPIPTVTATATNNTICSGSSTLVVATGALTYTWTPNASVTAINVAADSVNVNPTNNTNYTVVGVDAVGCTGTANVNINVAQAPAGNIVSSVANDSICVGSTVILTAPTAGFGTTYSWSDGHITRRDTVSPTITTTYIVTETAQNGCSANDTITIYVNAGTPPVVVVTPSTGVFCVGGPGVMLVATGASTYTWTPAATLSSANNDTVYASPTGGFGATVYTVTGSNGLCSSSATASVTRSTPPAKQAITFVAGNDTVCAGTQIILRGNPGGGGPGGLNSFAWSNGIYTRNDTVSPTTSTLYIVTVSNAAGCSTLDSMNIVVTAGTAPTMSFSPNSPASSCDGNPVTINITGNATSYTWAPATGLDTNVGTTVVATPANTTNYIITAVLGSCTTTATFTVAVGNSPALNATVYDMNGAAITDTVCAGSTVVLNALPGGGALPYTYSWSDGYFGRRDTITPTVSGTYTVVSTSNIGCVATDSIQLVLVPIANANFTFTNTNKTFNFTDASAGAMSWNWAFGDGNNSTSQNPTYTYASAGNYTVTLIITGACGNDTTTQDITVNADGIGSVNNVVITTYPNPVNDVLHIESSVTIAKVELLNALGQQVLTANANTSKVAVNVAQLTKGMYFVRITSKNGQRTERKITLN